MRRCTNRAGGFTLLETLLALGLTAALLGGVYAIASGTTELSSEISQERDRALSEQAFLALCRKSLGGLDLSANVKLFTAGAVGPALAEIVISGDPAVFAFSSIPPGATAVVLASEPEADGLLAVKLRYLDEADVAAFDQGSRSVGRELLLLQGVRQFDWRFFDRNGNRWKSTWDIQSGRPALAELTLAIDQNEPIRHVFWIPNLQPVPLPVPRPIYEKPVDNDK